MSATNRQYFFRTFKYVKPYAVLYTIGIFLYCAQQFFFPLINAIIMGQIMEGILAQEFSMVLDTVWLIVAMLAGFMVIIAFGVYVGMMNVLKATRDFTLDVFRSFMQTSLESEKHSGEGIAAINTDADMATNLFHDAISPFLMNVIAIVFSSVTVFIIDWRLGIGALAVGLIVFVAQICFAGPLTHLGKRRLETNAEAVKSVSNIFAGALTIRAFGRQRQAIISFDRENGKLKKIAFGQAFIGMWQDIFTTIQGWLTIVLVFVLGGWLVANGYLAFSQLMMVLPLATAIGSAVAEIGTNFANLQAPIVAAKRCFDIIDAAGPAGNPASSHYKEGSSPKKHPSKELTHDEDCAGLLCSARNYGLSITNLNFAYKNATQNALTDINLQIKPNQMVAFVGESGSGKSTLLRLIIGLYERANLNMTMGDLSFFPQNLQEWRSNFSYVDQSCKLFDMTIAENIAMGIPQQSWCRESDGPPGQHCETVREGSQGKTTEEAIHQAATRAFAHDFISALPEGYNTNCGEKGASLSGGQKQRIAIARALCRKSRILVFDEATSALDSESERNIMQTIENLRPDHTILITTHNLQNIQTADVIVVMDNGRIAETGNHAELVAKNGVYKRLLEAQNAI